MTKEKIKSVLEAIFEKLEFEFKKIEMDDDDLNYHIKSNGDIFIKGLGDVDFFLYYNEEQERLGLVKAVFYELEENDTDDFALMLSNEINQNIAIGKVYYNRDKKIVIYTDVRTINPKFIESEDVQSMVMSFMFATATKLVKLDELNKKDK